MRAEHLSYLVCPQCQSRLRIQSAEYDSENDIEHGALQCTGCALVYPIIRHIPRFVPLENYSNSFSLEWNRHARTQYDSFTGTTVSEQRFFTETLWPRDLSGQTILEAGSGSGRFTEQAAKTGAMVVSLDLSQAVEANWASNGRQPNVLIAQADIYHMPVPERGFEKVFCFGVLQHTPDVKRTFLTLPRYLKSGGELVVDVYRRYDWAFQMLNTKYWVRPLTRRMKPERLYHLVRAYVGCMWPLARLINKLPYGRWINVALLIADYRGIYALPEEILKEWAILDSFDKLSPRYDQPQTLETMQAWFREAALVDIDIQPGFNGIVGRARKT